MLEKMNINYMERSWESDRALLKSNDDIEMFGYKKSETNGELKEIKCFHCKELLRYPPDCYGVQCGKCFGVTAVKELKTLLCFNCGTNIYYLASSLYVTCKCGRVFNQP